MEPKEFKRWNALVENYFKEHPEKRPENKSKGNSGKKKDTDKASKE